MCIGPQRFRGIITDMSGISIPYAICSILAFVPAIVLHEMGHALAAYKLGDPTAKSQGRLSFNPINHVDPFGTVLPKGTDVGDYGYVDSIDELPFDQFMGILRAHDVESHNLESGWDGGGEGCHISIYFDNGQAFSMDTNKLPEDYEALREECAQAMADYYETVRDQGER